MPAIRRAGPQGAETMLQLALAYQFQGRLDEALDIVAQAQKALGPPDKADPFLLGEVSANRAYVLYSQTDLKRGLAEANAALDYYARANTPPPEAVAKLLSTKGLLLSDDQQFDAAEAAMGQALAIYRRTLGDRNRATAQAWYALALNEQAAGKLAQAENSINHALAIDRVVLDNDNPMLADAISGQGQIFQSEHKLDAAAAALNDAIATYHRAYGATNPQIGITLVYLALAESDRGHLAAALKDLDEAKHNYDVGYGKLHPNHGDLLVNRATILAKYGRRQEAIADCAAGIKILDQTLGADAAFTKGDADLCKKL